VPKALLNVTSSENLMVQLNDTDITAKSTITENTHTSIYFTYTLSTYEVQIKVVKINKSDNFPWVAIVCGVMIAVITITTFVILKKKKSPKTI
jgi:hypothetical protein